MRKIFLIMFLFSLMLFSRDYPYLRDSTVVYSPNIFVFVDSIKGDTVYMGPEGFKSFFIQGDSIKLNQFLKLMGDKGDTTYFKSDSVLSHFLRLRTFRDTSLFENLIHYWDFDEGSGDSVFDFIGENPDEITDMKINGASWVNGKRNWALEFDKNEENYVGNGFMYSTEFSTISAWIMPFSHDDDQVIMSANKNLGIPWGNRPVFNNIILHYTPFFSDTTWGVSIYSGTDVQLVSSGEKYNETNFPIGQNAFLAVTIDGDSVKFYHDDSLINVVKQDISQPTNLGAAFAIGRNGSSSYLYFDGIIDEIFIFDKALNSSEISKLKGYDPHRIGGKLIANQIDIDSIIGERLFSKFINVVKADTTSIVEDGLRGYWKFEEGSGDSIHNIMNDTFHLYKGSYDFWSEDNWSNKSDYSMELQGPSSGIFDWTWHMNNYDGAANLYFPFSISFMVKWCGKYPLSIYSDRASPSYKVQGFHIYLNSNDSSIVGEYGYRLEGGKFDWCEWKKKRFTIPNIIPINQWCNIVAIWDDTDSNHVEIYLNGERVDSATILQIQNQGVICDVDTMIHCDNGNMYVGNPCEGDDCFDYIDELMIYNKALTSEEIQKNYDYFSSLCYGGLLNVDRMINTDSLIANFIDADKLKGKNIEAETLYANLYLNIPDLISDTIKIVTQDVGAIDHNKYFDNLKEAVDSANINDIILIMEGIYLEKDTVHINRDGISIIAEEHVFFDSLIAIMVHGVDDITIKNIITDSTELYVQDSIVENLLVDNCKFKRFQIIADCDSIINAEIKNCKFVREPAFDLVNFKDAVNNGAYYSSITFDNCIFKGNRGIFYASQQNVEIHDIIKNSTIISNGKCVAEGAPNNPWAISMYSRYTGTLEIINCELIGLDSAGVILSHSPEINIYFKNCILKRELEGSSSANFVIDGLGKMIFEDCLIFYGDWEEYWKDKNIENLRGYGAVAHGGEFYFYNSDIFAGGGINASTYQDTNQAKIEFHNGYIRAKTYPSTIGSGQASPNVIDSLIISNSFLEGYWDIGVSHGSYLEMDNCHVKMYGSRSAITIGRGDAEYDYRNVVKVRNSSFEIPDSVSYFWGDTTAYLCAHSPFNSLDSNIYVLRVKVSEDTVGYSIDSTIKYIIWEDNNIISNSYKHKKAIAENLEDYVTGYYQMYQDSVEVKNKLIAFKADIDTFHSLKANIDSLTLTDTIVKFEESDSHLYITLADGSVYQCVDTLEKWVSEARVDTFFNWDFGGKAGMLSSGSWNAYVHADFSFITQLYNIVNQTYVWTPIWYVAADSSIVDSIEYWLEVKNDSVDAGDTIFISRDTLEWNANCDVYNVAKTDTFLNLAVGDVYLKLNESYPLSRCKATQKSGLALYFKENDAVTLGFRGIIMYWKHIHKRRF